MRIRDRESLIEWIVKESHAYRKIKRAVDAGNMVVLGGFNPIPPSTYGGWIIKINLVYSDEIEFYGIIVKFANKYSIINIPETDIPWKNWLGDMDNEILIHNLINGDVPNMVQLIKTFKDLYRSK